MLQDYFPPWAQVLNLDRYPIEDLTATPGRRLVEACRRSLAEDGSCEMPDFLTPLALRQLALEGRALEATAYHNTVVGNAYLDESDPTLPEDHPRRKLDATSLAAVAYDEIPVCSWLRKIYEWDPVMHFIGEILGLPEIYRYGDPMSGLNLSVMRSGDYLRWHFDQCDFVTSLAIQLPESGGEFEFVPRISTAADPNYPSVGQILAGNRQGVFTLPNKPGTLLLFQGRHSLHRVTPIQGESTRLVALFAYAEQADLKGTDYLRRIRYGRVTSRPIPQDFTEVGARVE